MIYRVPLTLLTFVLIFVCGMAELKAVDPNNLNEGFRIKSGDWPWWRGRPGMAKPIRIKSLQPNGAKIRTSFGKRKSQVEATAPRLLSATFIFRADPTKFEELGKNRLGDEVLSTPVIVTNQIFYRASQLREGQRQEFLYCIGTLTE